MEIINENISNVWFLEIYIRVISVKNQKEMVTYRYIGIGIDKSPRIGFGLESLHTDTDISVYVYWYRLNSLQVRENTTAVYCSKQVLTHSRHLNTGTI